MPQFPPSSFQGAQQSHRYEWGDRRAPAALSKACCEEAARADGAAAASPIRATPKTRQTTPSAGLTPIPGGGYRSARRNPTSQGRVASHNPSPVGSE